MHLSSPIYTRLLKLFRAPSSPNLPQSSADKVEKISLVKQMKRIKWKANMIREVWRRCRSLKDGNKTEPEPEQTGKRRIAPEGCFWVCVGPEKQRFVVKMEIANHPLFKILLEDAETEYGYNSDGPILLPCDVDLFYRVVGEIESFVEIDRSPTYTGNSWAALIPCSPARVSRCVSAYRLLSPSPMVKLLR